MAFHLVAELEEFVDFWEKIFGFKIYLLILSDKKLDSSDLNTKEHRSGR